MSHDPLRVALEIREQLASEKRRLGFFFGAGTSMAVGLPGINELTDQVVEHLEEPFKTQFEGVRAQLVEDANVENVLDRIRIYRELIDGSQQQEYAGLQGTAARDLDVAVCQSISEIVSGDPPQGLQPHLIMAQWLRALHSSRDWPVEIFTTNYDLLLEQAMEDSGVPFFDGFIGAVTPFFVPESVEAEAGRMNEFACPPRAWTRLWKLHGSINWHVQDSARGDRSRITRLSGLTAPPEGELMIFPSREKYVQSRKLPFITFQDRFRRFLSSGECLLVVAGYSFSDQHLNDIMLQGLRSNPRLAITALLYSDLSERLVEYGEIYRNLTLYGSDRACIGGIIAPWSEPSREPEQETSWPFWDRDSRKFTLGNFNALTSFLEVFIGFRSSSHARKAEDSLSTVTEERSQEVPTV